MFPGFTKQFSRHRGLRKLLLPTIILVFLISASVSIAQLRQIIAVLEAPRMSTTWAVTQLLQEHQRFASQLKIYHLGGGSKGELMLRYDIFWSRFKVLLEGQETITFRHNDVERRFVSDLFMEVQRIEPMLLSLNREHSSIASIIDSLEGYTPRLMRMVNYEFQRRGSMDEKNDAKMLRLQLSLALSFGVVFISGGLLIFYIVQENRHTRYLAYHDALTGLSNRAGLRAYIAQHCADHRHYALMMLDLNGFKGINDSYGHEFGDRILKAVAQRLQGLMRQQDVVCRIGGDEFCVVLTHVRSREDCSGLARRLIEALERPISMEGRLCLIGASIGISLADESKLDWLGVLGQADTAMYDTKLSNKGSSWKFYQGKMQRAKERQQTLRVELREALKQHKLELYYQAITDLSSNSIVGVEVQACWQHPNFGWVEQSELTELALSVGCISELEDWLLSSAAQQLKRWHHGVSNRLLLMVSLSSTTLHGDLVKQINRVLIESRVMASRLIINVIESNSRNSLLDAIDAINELRRIGVGLCLDNFGSADCPLDLLNDLPVQFLRGPLGNMLSKASGGDEQETLLAATVMFANRLGVKLVINGVRDEQQLAELQSISQEVYVLMGSVDVVAPAEAFSRYLDRQFNDG
ncbi:putative bifunctional diguanylate cyclase/phosphodiesterase [Aliagarivorans marinus]|uniref:putative bifunctional diguanylate cyclase/phosphodiesterase n=1 Tax=Aliagarivorans marinus TaxID=561965 RepID=UPI00047DA881|nr:diguanylate cyclase [Aliagarivorans marinus]